jgi:hypothetical protein
MSPSIRLDFVRTAHVGLGTNGSLPHVRSMLTVYNSMPFYQLIQRLLRSGSDMVRFVQRFYAHKTVRFANPNVSQSHIAAQLESLPHSLSLLEKKVR